MNKSLKSDVVELDWKNARVTPIHKDDGDINDENKFSLIDQSYSLKRQTSLHRVIDDWLENVYDSAITVVCLLDIWYWFHQSHNSVEEITNA